jgi:hypothetical protein
VTDASLAAARGRYIPKVPDFLDDFAPRTVVDGA